MGDKMTHCIIEPMDIESLEAYCEKNDIYYEYFLEDGECVVDGLHIFMRLSDYLAWWADGRKEEIQ